VKQLLSKVISKPPKSTSGSARRHRAASIRNSGSYTEFISPASSDEIEILFDNFPIETRIKTVLLTLTLQEVLDYYDGMMADETYPELPAPQWEGITLQKSELPIFKSRPTPTYQVSRVLGYETKRLVSSFILAAMQLIHQNASAEETNLEITLRDFIFKLRLN
jgi:hypothetical protein